MNGQLAITHRVRFNGQVKTAAVGFTTRLLGLRDLSDHVLLDSIYHLSFEPGSFATAKLYAKLGRNLSVEYDTSR